jgi:hypothetical protein
MSGPSARRAKLPAETGVESDMRSLLGAVAVALVSVACTPLVGSRWDEPWNDRRGREVPNEVVSTFEGAEHCEWDSAVFLHVGWPLGRAARNASQARQYIRDPEGLFEDEVRLPFDDDAALPRHAEYTGYHLGDVELWLSPADAASAAYLVDGDDVERWTRPRDEPIACA